LNLSDLKNELKQNKEIVDSFEKKKEISDMIQCEKAGFEQNVKENEANKTDELWETEFAEENNKLSKEIKNLLDEMAYVKKVFKCI
jgi:hypothetical protein